MLANRFLRVGCVCLTVWLLSLTPATAQTKSGFHWKNDEVAGVADLFVGEQPVLRYVYAYDTSSPQRIEETFKVFHHMYGPGTKTLITKGPSGLIPFEKGQYHHHRGLYVGWNKTSFEGGSADFWHCSKREHLKHEKFVAMTGDEQQGAMSAEIHWNDQTGKLVIVETRSVTVRPEANVNGWRIDWSSKLESRRGEVSLDGDRQHAGFQYRADQFVSDKKNARFIRPANLSQNPVAIEVGDQGNPPQHVDLNWFAMTYELDGKRFNVEYFDNPHLPKPALFSERPYGRFGTFFKTKLTPDKPLELKYRLIVSAGEASSVDAIQKRYDQFVTELKKP